MKYHLTLLTPKIKKYRQYVQSVIGDLDYSYIAAGMQNGTTTLENNLVVLQTKYVIAMWQFLSFIPEK